MIPTVLSQITLNWLSKMLFNAPADLTLNYPSSVFEKQYSKPLFINQDAQTGRESQSAWIFLKLLDLFLLQKALCDNAQWLFKSILWWGHCDWSFIISLCPSLENWMNRVEWSTPTWSAWRTLMGGSYIFQRFMLGPNFHQKAFVDTWNHTKISFQV